MNDIENKILEFIQNRDEKGETTAPRHVHIRFGIENEEIEEILKRLSKKEKISKLYDKQYQEDRYWPVKTVKE